MVKIILLCDVAKVGQRYEVKNLTDGFARNFVLARGWGMGADQKNLAKLEILKRARSAGRPAGPDELAKRLTELTEPLTITARANEQGHLFAKIHQTEIAAALGQKLNLKINPDLIILDEPIKQVGEYQVELKRGKVPLGQLTLTILTDLTRAS